MNRKKIELMNISDEESRMALIRCFYTKKIASRKMLRNCKEAKSRGWKLTDTADFSYPIKANRCLLFIIVLYFFCIIQFEKVRWYNSFRSRQQYEIYTRTIFIVWYCIIEQWERFFACIFILWLIIDVN